MRILVLNPNISDEITCNLKTEADKIASDYLVLDTVHVKNGIEYIETEREALIASMSVVEYVADVYQKYDGIVIAAFGDPGVSFLKTRLGIPVIGLTEASLYSAALLGNTIGVYTLSDSFIPWYKKMIIESGMFHKISFIKGININVFNRDRNESVLDVVNSLKDCHKKLSTTEMPDVIILAGAPFSGIAQELVDLNAPVVDGLLAAIRLCSSLSNITHRATKTNVNSTIKKTKNISENVINLLTN